jgi:hypothetical protein
MVDCSIENPKIEARLKDNFIVMRQDNYVWNKINLVVHPPYFMALTCVMFTNKDEGTTNSLCSSKMGSYSQKEHGQYQNHFCEEKRKQSPKIYRKMN